MRRPWRIATRRFGVRPNDAQILAARGFTYLKMGSLDDAVADYDAVIRVEPKAAMPLFGRGVAKRLKGDAAGSEADIAAARAIKPNAEDEWRLFGLK